MSGQLSAAWGPHSILPHCLGGLYPPASPAAVPSIVTLPEMWDTKRAQSEAVSLESEEATGRKILEAGIQPLSPPPQARRTRWPCWRRVPFGQRPRTPLSLCSHPPQGLRSISRSSGAQHKKPDFFSCSGSVRVSPGGSSAGQLAAGSDTGTQVPSILQNYPFQQVAPQGHPAGCLPSSPLEGERSVEGQEEEVCVGWA